MYLLVTIRRIGQGGLKKKKRNKNMKAHLVTFYRRNKEQYQKKREIEKKKSMNGGEAETLASSNLRDLTLFFSADLLVSIVEVNMASSQKFLLKIYSGSMLSAYVEHVYHFIFSDVK